MSESAQRGAKAFTFTDTKSPMPEVNSGFFMPAHIAETGQPFSFTLTVGLSAEGGVSCASSLLS